MIEYNFKVDFGDVKRPESFVQVHGLSSNYYKATQGDNLSRILRFEFAKELKAEESAVLTIKNSNMENAVTYILNVVGLDAEFLIPSEVL